MLLYFRLVLPIFSKAFIAPLLQYNRRLDEFIYSVPIYLKLCQYGEGAKFNSNSVALQQQVLYSRYAFSHWSIFGPGAWMS